MIQINNLTKHFGRFTALNNICLSIPRGSVTAIIGPNASGKTTLLKAIVGLVRFNDGAIYIGKEKVNGSASYRNNIGYMPQFPGFPENLTVGEVIKMAKELRPAVKEYDEELYACFQLQQQIHKNVRTLSGGTKQKLSAYLTLLFQPSLLILDEPTASLDSVASIHLKDVITRLQGEGKTILLASHNIHELDEIADRLILLLESNIRYHGSIPQLKNQFPGFSLEKAIAKLTEPELEKL
ncbi:MAG: ABC transporter ATP-binding protein [Ignavibacteriales bacterium]|nr:ABC transporter ATP-binding protein [Ignavibacteriales bacterium]